MLSSDDVRFLLVDDPTEQSIHRIVFATIRMLLRRRLELQRPVTYIDATNLTHKDRRAYIKMAQLYGAHAEAFFFDTPLEICKQRNANRDRVVPEDAMDAMAARLVPPSVEEGFNSVRTMHVYTGPSGT